MRGFFWVMVLLACVQFGRGAGLAPFVFVMVDGRTEELHGAMPLSRKVVAQAVDQLVKAGAEGVVLKFFYDLPSVEEADGALEASICAGRVALQGALNHEAAGTNRLDKKFGMEGKVPEGFPEVFTSGKALLPLARFSRCAAGVGFVDSAAGFLPVIEVYQGQIVKSLALVALELASKQKAALEGGEIVLGGKKLELLHEIKFSGANELDYIPLHEVMDGKSKGWQGKVKGAVVIVGYDGGKIHRIESQVGPLGAHRYFIAGLRSLAASYGK